MAVLAFFALVAAYPLLEAWASGDRHEHHLLDRPHTTPTRTGIGVAGVTFFGTLRLAGSADIIATQFWVPFEGVIRLLRGIVLLGPPLAFVLTRQACFALQGAERERQLHGAESGRIVRLPEGGYIAPHTSLGTTPGLVAARAKELAPPRKEHA